MKYILYTMTLMAAVLLAGCEEEDSRLEEVAVSGERGVVPVITSAVKSSFKLSDVAGSQATFTVEFKDSENGNSVESYNWSVTHDDNTATVMQLSSFSPNDDGIQSVSSAITMNEVLTALGITSADISEQDTFIFNSSVVLKDGATFSSSNSNAGRFDALWSFSVTVATETVILDSWTRNNTYLMDGDQDTLRLVFDMDLVVSPTVTRLSAGSNTDDVLGAETTTSEEDSVYVAYEAGAAMTDTIAFVVAGAEAVAGFPMVNDTLKVVFIADNIAPDPDVKSLGFTLENVADAADSIANIDIKVIYGEALSSDSVVYSVTSADFDDFEIKKPVTSGTDYTEFSFTPMIGDAKVEAETISFDVTITGAKDLAGNEVNKTGALTIL